MARRLASIKQREPVSGNQSDQRNRLDLESAAPEDINNDVEQHVAARDEHNPPWTNKCLMRMASTSIRQHRATETPFRYTARRARTRLAAEDR